MGSRRCRERFDRLRRPCLDLIGNTEFGDGGNVLDLTRHSRGSGLVFQFLLVPFLVSFSKFKIF